MAGVVVVAIALCAGLAHLGRTMIAAMMLPAETTDIDDDAERRELWNVKFIPKRIPAGRPASGASRQNAAGPGRLDRAGPWPPGWASIAAALFESPLTPSGPRRGLHATA
jgi:hypothetical protein